MILELKARIASGDTITADDLAVCANRVFGGTKAEGAHSGKAESELLELATNLAIVEDARRFDPTVDANRAKQIMRDLAAMVERHPTQTRRDAEQEAFQQFSTPPHLAYVMAWVAKLMPSDAVLEPSAGLGGLGIFALNAGCDSVYVNELSKRRSVMLKAFNWTGAFSENADHLNAVLPQDIQPSVVLMNPPFSATGGRMGDKCQTQTGALHVEQCLKRLRPNGRLVALLGRGMSLLHPVYRNWWPRISDEYAVKANVSIPGAEYKKFGTQFQTQLVVIDKTGGNKLRGVVIGDCPNLEAAIDLLAETRRQRPAIEPRVRTAPVVEPPKTVEAPAPVPAPPVEPAKPIDAAQIAAVVEQAAQMTDAVFEAYRPQRLRIVGAILQCVKFAVNGSTASITATDREMAYTRSFAVSPAPASAAVVDAQTLEGIARECPGTLSIEMGQDMIVRHTSATKATAHVPTGRLDSEFRLYASAAGDFPAIEPLGADRIVCRIGRADLIRGLTWAMNAADEHFGLAIRQEEGDCVSFGGTTGHILSTLNDVPAQNQRRINDAMAFPRKFADTLLRILKESDDESIDLFADKIGESPLVAFAGRCWNLMTLPAACHQANFPRAAWTLINRDFATMALCEAAKFQKAFRAAAKFIRKEGLVNIAVSENNITLSSGHGGERFEQAIRCTTAGPATQIKLAPKALDKWLRLLGHSKWLGFACNDLYQPTAFHCSGNPKAFWIVSGQQRPKKEAVAAAAQAA